MKKRILWIIISFNFIIFPLYQISHATDFTLNNTPTQVCFSPKGGCTEAIISQIVKAKSEILVQASSFTSGTFMANSGILTLIDDRHAIDHNKIMIFERERVITDGFVISLISSLFVIPVKTGIQSFQMVKRYWIPAYETVSQFEKRVKMLIFKRGITPKI